MVRLDVELVAVEPVGDLVYVEGRGVEGVQVALYLPPATLRGIAAAAGMRVSIALELPAAAAPQPLRERMGRPVTATPRSASPPPTGGPAGAPPRSDASAAILSLLGKPSAGDGLGERDVDDEMDALLGRMTRGPGN